MNEFEAQEEGKRQEITSRLAPTTLREVRHSNAHDLGISFEGKKDRFQLRK